MKLLPTFALLTLSTLALAACWGTHAEDPKAAATLVPVRGTAYFKVLQPDLRNGIAVFGERDVVMYWDDNTIFVRDGHRVRDSALFKIGASFEFKGFEAHQEINLNVVLLK